MCIFGGLGLSNLNAQTTVTIGSGQSENDKFPLYTYYEYSISQQIYTADDLEQLAAGDVIKSIAFYVTNSASKQREFSIYLKNTTKDAFDSATDYVSMDNADLVYSTTSGSFSATGWITFTLDTPFTYNGDNLLLCVHDYLGGWDTSVASFSLNQTDKNRAIFRFDQDPIGDPVNGINNNGWTGMITGHNQIQLTFEASSTPVPFTLTASAAAETIFDNETVKLTAKAKGGSGNYTYSWSPATGLDNASSATPIFTPTAVGTYTFTCTVSDGTETLTADVTVTVNEAPKIIEIGSSASGFSDLPTNIYYKYSLTQQIYTSAEIGVNKNINITSIAFNNLSNLEDTRNIEVYMRNTTDNECTGTSVVMSSNECVYKGNVTFVANGWTTIYFTTDFEYEAGKNVLLCVVDKSGRYQGGAEFAVYTTSSSSYYYRSDSYQQNADVVNYGTSVNCRNHIKLEYEETVPSAPVLTATATSETSISLTWDAVSGATNYNVYSGEVLVTSTTETSFLHESLTTGETYCYTVKAVNEVGESPASNEACATPALPGVPTNLMISVNGTSITLEWDAVDGATTYRVYDENDNIVETSLNTYTFTGLAEDTRYCYAVSAVSPVGESDKSDCVCAKTTKAGSGGDEEITIGNENSQNMSQYIPIYSYAANKYSMSQQYYTKDEINATGGNITSIAFHVAQAVPNLTHNWEIYLNNIDEITGFPSDDYFYHYQVSSSDLVFKGDVTFPENGWVEINLDEPLTYEGNHILVTVVDNSLSGNRNIAFTASLSSVINNVYYVTRGNSSNIMDPTKSTGTYTMGVDYGRRNDIRFTFSAPAPTIEFINDGDYNTASNWNTGVVPSTTDDVIIKANATINGDVAVKHLSVEGGSLTIESGSLTVADIMVNNYAEDLIIKDGAQLLQGYDKVKGTFQMNINKPEEWSEWNKTGWQFIASPFTNAAVSQFTDADTYDLYKFDGRHENITEEWRNHKDSTANFETEFVSGRGYMASYQNNTTATLSGTFYAGSSITYPVTYQDIQEGETHWPNFHLLGNPFTFNMDLSNLNMTNMATGVAVVNEVGGYDYMETGTINVGDGFFVKSAAASPSVSYGTRGGNNNVSENISVRVSNSTSRDNVVLNFAGADKVGFPKLNARNEDIAYLYVVDNEERYGIFNYDKDVKEVPLSFEAQKMGNYTISVDAEGEYETIVLVDRQTGIETNMLLEDYNFTTTTSKKENTDRFIVRLTFKSDIATESERFAYQSGDELIIEAEGTVQIFDVMGRMVYNSDVKSRGERINVGHLNKAAYLLRLVNGEGVKVQKVIIY